MIKQTLLTRINCASCIKRLSCKSLCEAAKEYANQDQVRRKEKLLTKPISYQTWGPWAHYEVEPGVIMNEKQLCAAVLLSAGVPHKIIRKGMKLKQPQLWEIVRFLKKAYR